jgi:uncharacterized protein
MEFWSNAWADISPAQYFAIAVIVISGGIIRGATGFGGAMVMTLPLSLIFRPAEAIITVLLLELAGPVRLLQQALKTVVNIPGAKRTLGTIALSALLILPLGIALQTYLDRQIITLFMAIAVLVCALALIVRIPRQLTPTSPRASLAGATSGLMLALTGICGPPVVLYVHATETNHQLTRSLLMLYITGASLVMVTMSAIAQSVGILPFVYAIVLTPIFFIGNLMGHRVAARVSGSVTRLTSLWLLVAGSSVYLIKTLL